MNASDRQDFNDMKQDVRGIKDDMHLMMTNHLPHLEDEVEQAWGMAEAAEKSAKRTERFVLAGIAFMGLIVAIVAAVS